jgi:hypothetical protein
VQRAPSALDGKKYRRSRKMENTHILLEPKRRADASHSKAVAKSPENAPQGRGYSN